MEFFDWFRDFLFMLLTSLHHYEDQRQIKLASHLSYLTACYLFIALTSPGSGHLALHYINKAISLNPCDEYKEWLALIQKGN